MSPAGAGETPAAAARPGIGSAGTVRRSATWLWLALAVVIVLHHDFWLWDPPPRLVLGLPAGLLYHAFYCVAAAALMALAVRRAWPPPGIGGG